MLHQKGNSNIWYAMVAGHKVDKMMNLNSHIGGQFVICVDEGLNVTNLCSQKKQGSDLFKAFKTSPK